MKPARTCTYLMLAACGLIMPLKAVGTPAQVTFETVPVGTTYGGGSGDVQGEVVLIEDDIAMSVEGFLVDQFTGFFNSATVGGLYDDYFPTTPLSLNNISVRFDFTALEQGGFQVNEVTLEYMEFGGVDNFQVNGQDFYIPTAIPGLPVQVTDEVVLYVTPAESMRLVGPVHTLLIGGQELAIDNVTAIPEPATILLLGIGVFGLAQRWRRRAL